MNLDDIMSDQEFDDFTKHILLPGDKIEFTNYTQNPDEGNFDIKVTVWFISTKLWNKVKKAKTITDLFKWT